MLMMVGAHAYPGAFRNGVVRVDGRVPAAEVLQRAQAFFAERGRGYTQLARAGRRADVIATLQIVGLAPLADSPCMLIESPVAEPVVPQGVHIESMTSLRHLQEVVAINAEACEALRLPASGTRMFFGRPQDVLSPRMTGFAVYRAGLPVSTALTLARVVVTLQASPLGEPIYQRLGYRSHDRQLRFRFPAPDPVGPSGLR